MFMNSLTKKIQLAKYVMAWHFISLNESMSINVCAQKLEIETQPNLVLYMTLGLQLYNKDQILAHKLL